MNEDAKVLTSKLTIEPTSEILTHLWAIVVVDKWKTHPIFSRSTLILSLPDFCYCKKKQIDVTFSGFSSQHCQTSSL